MLELLNRSCLGWFIYNLNVHVERSIAMRIAINGFGRIGRAFLRTVLLDVMAAKSIEVVAINEGPKQAAQLDVLFKYDSVMGEFSAAVTADEHTLTIGSRSIKRFAQADPAQLPWADLKIDWVIEASGFFTSHEKASQHIKAGAKKVLITAPSKDADCAIVPGINNDAYHADQHTIVSLASCTTNCFAAVLKVLAQHVTLFQGMMTTVHAYTNTQALLDVADDDARKSRAAALNIIPTKTGANDVINKIFPQYVGKLDAMAIRVPVPDVSLIDFTFVTQETLTAEQLNTLFYQASKTTLLGVLAYSDQPLVSSDYIGNPHAAIFDSLLTKCNGSMSKISAWYDNEFGYSSRIKDFLLHND